MATAVVTAREPPAAEPKFEEPKAQNGANGFALEGIEHSASGDGRHGVSTQQSPRSEAPSLGVAAAEAAKTVAEQAVKEARRMQVAQEAEFLSLHAQLARMEQLLEQAAARPMVDESPLVMPASGPLSQSRQSRSPASTPLHSRHPSAAPSPAPVPAQAQLTNPPPLLPESMGSPEELLHASPESSSNGQVSRPAPRCQQRFPLRSSDPGRTAHAPTAAQIMQGNLFKGAYAAGREPGELPFDYRVRPQAVRATAEALHQARALRQRIRVDQKSVPPTTEMG